MHPPEFHPNFHLTIEETDDSNRPILVLRSDNIILKSRIEPHASIRSASARWLDPDDLAGRLIHAAYIPTFAARPGWLYYEHGELQQKAITGIVSKMIHELSVLNEFKQNAHNYVCRIRELLTSELDKPEYSKHLCDESFRQAKSALRKRLKAGEIDNLEYQRLLYELNLLNKKYHSAVFHAEKRFMEEYETKGFMPLNIDDINILSAHARSNIPADDLWKSYIAKS